VNILNDGGVMPETAKIKKASIASPTFVNPAKDMVRKKGFHSDSWFITGHFESTERIFDFMLHQMVLDRKNGEPVILQSIVSLAERTAGIFRGEEKIFPLSEVKVSETQFDISAPNGSMCGTMERMVVRAALPGVEINVDGRVAGPVLYNCGTGAYPAFGSTVHQYGIPTIEASGTISVEGDTYEVAGSCWFDRQWQDVGAQFFNADWHWAWMGLKMANGDRISLWEVTEGDRRNTWATVLQPDGMHLIVDVEPLEANAFDHWVSIASGQTYPTRWAVNIPALDTRLEVMSYPKDQEIVSPIGINKYEGASSVRGVYKGCETSGYTYVEMVGKWS
jgi:hypothetical protein